MTAPRRDGPCARALDSRPAQGRRTSYRNLSPSTTAQRPSTPEPEPDQDQDDPWLPWHDSVRFGCAPDDEDGGDPC